VNNGTGRHKEAVTIAQVIVSLKVSRHRKHWNLLTSKGTICEHYPLQLRHYADQNLDYVPVPTLDHGEADSLGLLVSSLFERSSFN
jgi:hypothetical protein